MEVMAREDTLTVVVDRHKLSDVHPYCVHGYTHCGRCRFVVALGSETLGKVQAGATPLCMVCALELYEMGELPTTKRIGRVRDHHA